MVLAAGISGSVVVCWTCNQKIGGTNLVTIILEPPFRGLFLMHFQDKTKSQATSVREMFF